MNLYMWAHRWQLPVQALDELKQLYRQECTETVVEHPGYTEAAVQSRIRLEASRKGMRVWRNNVGAVVTAENRMLRYGLANDSKAVNEKMKSSDLIGIRPVKITSRYVGGVIGQFVAREVKPSRWSYRGTEREKAQLNFLQLINSMGGDASFAASDNTL